MRRMFQTVLLFVCLALALAAPRGLVLAAIVAGIGIARAVNGQPGRRWMSNRES